MSALIQSFSANRPSQGPGRTNVVKTLSIQTTGGTAHTVGFGVVLSQLVTAVPTAQYKVSAVGGVAINVAAYDYFI